MTAFLRFSKTKKQSPVYGEALENFQPQLNMLSHIAHGCFSMNFEMSKVRTHVVACYSYANALHKSYCMVIRQHT